MSEIHFRSHFWPFQIDQSFWISEIHFRSQFWPFFFRSIQNFLFRRPFWMSENHFRWHFWPFHTELYLFFEIFDKMPTDGHFGCPQITFDRISGHFRSIRNFLFWKFLDKMAAGRHFGWDDLSEIFG